MSASRRDLLPRQTRLTYSAEVIAKRAYSWAHTSAKAADPAEFLQVPLSCSGFR